MPDVETVDEEVAFWRSFISWWAREKEEPVPPRAWEALDFAEQKQRGLESTQPVQQAFRFT
jgi:hypothetical protein